MEMTGISENNNRSRSSTDDGEDSSLAANVSASLCSEEGILLSATPTEEACAVPAPRNQKKMNFEQEAISSAFQHDMENMDPKDARIHQLERHLEIMLDENNLLNLELQDLRKSSSNKISSLEDDVAHIELKFLEMENRMRDFKASMNRLKISLDLGCISSTAKAALAEIEALILRNDDDNDSRMVNIRNNDKIYAQNLLKICDSYLHNQSAAPTENELHENQIKEDKEEKSPVNKGSDELSKENVAVPNAQSTQNMSLRRSKRKSVSTSQSEVEIKSLPVLLSESPVISQNQEPKSPLKITNSPPVLQPEVDVESTTKHAVDTSQSEGFYCVCGRNYLSKQKLLLHIRQFTCDWKFDCDKCGLKFFEAFKLKKHMKRIHGDHKAEFHGCYTCGTKFENRRDLYIHQKDLHNCGPFAKEKLKAENNSDQFPAKRKRAYTRRVTSVFTKPGHPGKRDYPSKMKTQNVLKRNKSKATATTLPCIMRGEAFKSEESTGVPSTDDMSSMTNDHRVDTSKDGYFCVCGTTCTSKSGLDVHIKYFTYDAKFACTHCDRKFFSTCLLRAHMKSKHDILFTGKDGCRRCGRCFPSRLKLYQHCKTVHKCGPLMVNMKKRKRSPEPKPPILEPEGILRSSEEIAAAADSHAITSPESETCRKPSTDNDSTTSKIIRKRRSRNIVAVVDTTEKNLSLEKKEGTPLKKPIDTDNDTNKMVLVDSKLNGEINVSAQAPEELATPTRKRKTPTKYKDHLFQIIPGVFSSEAPKRRGPGRPPKKFKQLSEQITTSRKEIQPKRRTVHKVEKATRNGTNAKCTCGMIFAAKSDLYFHIRSKSIRKALKLKVKEGQSTNRIAATSPVTKTKEMPALPIDAGKNKDMKQKTKTKKSGVHGVANSKKEFMCLCGMQFMREVTLHEHLRLKIGKRVFKCDSCPESFSRYDYFKDHLRRAHQKTCEGMACRDCGARGFLSHKELRQHRTESHPSDKKLDNEQV